MTAVPMVADIACLDAVQLRTRFFVLQCLTQTFSYLGKGIVCLVGQFTLNLRKSSLGKPRVVCAKCSDIIVNILILFSKVSQFEVGLYTLPRLFFDMLSPCSNSLVKVSHRPR
jgi:hypothetical protein